MYSAIVLYKGHKAGKMPAIILKKFSKIIMLLSLQITELIKIDKDEVRGFFIEINNIIVKQQKIKCSKDKILLLIPHCLQNSECGYKITNNPYNCKRCGKCCVNDILKIVEEYNIKVCVASGGTMARKAVTETNPDAVIAVACSRDLMSGILDIGDIPIIAIENYRPEGPCINTKVDIEKIKKALKEILD